MPTRVKLAPVPMGIAAEACPAGQTTAKIIMRGYCSSDDGPEFVTHAEGFGNTLLRAIGQTAFPPSGVDHLLAVIQRDGTADVYLNELAIRFMARTKRAVEAGEGVKVDDISSVSRLTLGVPIPDDCGYILLLSCGWRRAFVFDTEPIHPHQVLQRKYDPEAIFGQLYGELLFQQYVRIEERTWQELLRQGWFPFRALSTDCVKRLIGHANERWNVDDLLDEVAVETTDQLGRTLASWREQERFKEHLDVFDTALERYSAGDFISCTGLLFPRLEGFMRTVLQSASNHGKPTARDLIDNAVPSAVTPFGTEGCLLPSRFRTYLSSVVFAGFNPNDDDVPVSRHSVSHGVADVRHFNKKWATIGFLTLYQLTLHAATLLGEDG